jgi:hypothetical protein
MRTGLADLDFPTFPVRPIYFPVRPKKFLVPAPREFAGGHGTGSALGRGLFLQPPVPDRRMPGAIEMPTANRDD